MEREGGDSFLLRPVTSSKTPSTSSSFLAVDEERGPSHSNVLSLGRILLLLIEQDAKRKTPNTTGSEFICNEC